MKKRRFLRCTLLLRGRSVSVTTFTSSHWRSEGSGSLTSSAPTHSSVTTTYATISRPSLCTLLWQRWRHLLCRRNSCWEVSSRSILRSIGRSKTTPSIDTTPPSKTRLWNINTRTSKLSIREVPTITSTWSRNQWRISHPKFSSKPQNQTKLTRRCGSSSKSASQD